MTKVAIFCPNCGEEQSQYKYRDKGGWYKCAKCKERFIFFKDRTESPQGLIWAPGDYGAGFHVRSHENWEGEGTPRVTVTLFMDNVPREDVKKWVRELRIRVIQTLDKLTESARWHYRPAVPKEGEDEND